jgi:hypothetical protein
LKDILLKDRRGVEGFDKFRSQEAQRYACTLFVTFLALKCARALCKLFLLGCRCGVALKATSERKACWNACTLLRVFSDFMDKNRKITDFSEICIKSVPL